MSGHVQVLLCEEPSPECEEKWRSESNFINPTRGDFLLDHPTIQWHEGTRQRGEKKKQNKNKIQYNKIRYGKEFSDTRNQ